MGQLLGGERDAANRGAVSADQALGERAPAATDLQDALPAIKRQELRDPIELPVLRLFERFAAGKQRGRIIHAGIEPRLKEIVTEIVMRGDVAAAAAPRIGAKRMANAIAYEARQPPFRLRRHGGFIAHAQFEQLRQIGRRPVAIDIAARNPVFAIGQEPPCAAPVPQHDRSFGAGNSAVPRHGLAGRQNDVQPAGAQCRNGAFEDAASQARP